MTWIVMEVVYNARRLWAWCLVDTGPGFDQVTLTETDGMTLVDMPDDGVRFGAFLFSVPAGDPVSEFDDPRPLTVG